MIWDNNEDICLIRCNNRRREIRKALKACREERRPYVFITPTMRDIHALNRILVPVTMLEEEVYKAEICTYLARKTGAHIVLLQAKDFGHKASRNVQKIITHIQTVSQRTSVPISYELIQAKKNSFALATEAVIRQRETAHQLLLLTASREYSLDDLIFGPPELHAISQSQVPVMLINPRADLFSLCD